MSYLFPPRLHFSGRFQADVSTVNNDPKHYDSRTFQANYDVRGQGRQNGWWNPCGTGAWRLVECIVGRVAYADGSYADKPADDPVIGGAVRGTDSRVAAKIVDLDPQQQMVSEIWGFQVILRALAGDDTTLGFQSDFEPAAFADIWKRFPLGKPDSMFGAFYQSVLHITEWHTGNSQCLDELSMGGKAPELLSIRFNVDGYDDRPDSRTFTCGRITGSIGRYLPHEPKHFVAGRALEPTQQATPLKSAYGQIQGDTLWLDLGNSIPTQAPGGDLDCPGPLYAAIWPAGGVPLLLGGIPCSETGWYAGTSGIAYFRLTEEQLKLAACNPLAIIKYDVDTPQALLLEAPDGRFVRADRFVFRLNPGDTQEAILYATAFGAPAPGQTIELGDNSLFLQGKGGLDGAVTPKVGKPQQILSLPPSTVTGPDGTAIVKLTASDPGRPRQYIDGQLYGISYAFPGPSYPVQPIRNPSRNLNTLVFSGHTIPDEPTWLSDIQPVFEQYDNLYPVMRPIVDLSNYASVVGRLGMLRRVFETPESDPNYMPVTRDLSRAKREMIRKWMKRPVYMRLDSKDELIRALRLAVEVEHATIPPYLCALYSLKQGTNVMIAAILHDIVMQEMVHMVRVCNLLVAIGATPKIDDPSFVPRYPGPMPGGLRGGLTVRLRRCSISQIRDVFMSMEEPETTVTPGSPTSYVGPVQHHRFTIGWFYDEIDRAVRRLYRSGEIKFGHVDRQVTKWPGPPKIAGTVELQVTNLKQARFALRTIKEQGESTKPFAPSELGDEVGHYYRFLEIVEGRRIEIDPGTRVLSFTGSHIPFDHDGVWPMIDDPDLTRYPPDSRAFELSKRFAETYQALLKGLHLTFSDNPKYLDESLGLMYSLNLAARELMCTPSGIEEGATAGPSFQLVNL